MNVEDSFIEKESRANSKLLSKAFLLCLIGHIYFITIWKHSKKKEVIKMETEKKKALLELIKECNDAEYLRQISYTALMMANAVAAIKKANSLADESANTKKSTTYNVKGIKCRLITNDDTSESAHIKVKEEYKFADILT